MRENFPKSDYVISSDVLRSKYSSAKCRILEPICEAIRCFNYASARLFSGGWPVDEEHKKDMLEDFKSILNCLSIEHELVLQKRYRLSALYGKLSNILQMIINAMDLIEKSREFYIKNYLLLAKHSSFEDGKVKADKQYVACIIVLEQQFKDIAALMNVIYESLRDLKED